MPIFHTEEARIEWAAKCKASRLRNKQKRGTIILLDGIQAQVDELDKSISTIRQMKNNLLKTAQKFQESEYAQTAAMS